MFFSVLDLDERGFVKHTRLSTFFGWCWQCRTYRSIAWWQSPPIHSTLGAHVTACEACGAVNQLDAIWAARQFPPVREAIA